jgi:hypothetical protein
MEGILASPNNHNRAIKEINNICSGALVYSYGNTNDDSKL